MESTSYDFGKAKLRVILVKSSKEKKKKAIEIQREISKKVGDWKGSEFIIKWRRERAI